jgi:hypothetical protein
MLRITADVFSGRPNPVWEVSDEGEARTTLRELTGDRTLLAETEPAQSGLGFRGFRIEMLNDELAQDFSVGASVYLAVGPQARGPRAAEFAERLIALSERGETPTGTVEGAMPLETPLRDFLTTQLELPTRLPPRSRVSVADEAEIVPPEEAAAPAVTCNLEFGAFNPGFWNNDARIKKCNNCYNYASNWRTDTFAQPGLGCGRELTAANCGEVTRAALCDGMHRRFSCFPDAEKPRWLVAMVVAPSIGDYHWYRKHKEGFWGHKPGQTEARNYDNRGPGHVISNPETADRGPYTLFCGYFYTCKSQARRIRGHRCPP